MGILSIRDTIGDLFRRRFVQDVLVLQAGSIFTMGMTFIKSVVLARMLGVEGFGQYAVILTFVGTMTILTNLGQHQAVATFFAESYARKDASGMRTIMRYYYLLSGLAACILLLLAIFAPQLAQWLYQNEIAGNAARIAFLAALLGLGNTLFITILQTVREIKLMTVLENADITLQVITSIILLQAGFGITGIFLGLMLTNTLMLALYIITYYKIRDRYAIPPLRSCLTSSPQPIGVFFRQGLWIAVDKNLGNLFPQGFLFIMSLVAPASVIGIAQLSYNIASLPSTILLPHLTRMATTVIPSVQNAGTAVLRNTCALLVKHALALHALVSIGSLVVLPFLVLSMYGSSYDAVIPPMLWIILIRIMSALNVVNSPLFRLHKKAHVPAIWNMITLPILFCIFVGLLKIMDPLQAFVWIIFLSLASGMWLIWYLYRMIIVSPKAAR